MRISSPTRAPMLALVALSLLSGGVEARDAAPPRRRAATPSGAIPLDVQEMGARAATATDGMRARMREHVAHQLRVLTEEHLLTSPQGYLVDGSIDALDVVEKADGLEISCAVRLILSARRSGAMLAMTTGQATLKNARRPRAEAQEARLELEVLDGAVRAASDELLQHFEARRKT